MQRDPTQTIALGAAYLIGGMFIALNAAKVIAYLIRHPKA